MIFNKRITEKTLTISILILVIVLKIFGSVKLERSGDTIADTITSIWQKNGEYVSIPHFCEKLGIKWQWDIQQEKMTCVINGKNVDIFQDNNFINMGDSTVQLPFAPLRYGGSIYMWARSAVDVFSDRSGYKLRWDKGSGTISAEYPNPVEDFQNNTDFAIKNETVMIKDESDKERERQNDSPKGVVEDQSIKIIVIDPGHGGKDPGAIGQSGVKEKDVVLQVALLLRDKLKSETDISVFMTREDDTFIPLNKRTKFANDKKADLFISIHANSIGGNKKKKEQIRGYKIYFLSQAKNEEDKLVAMRENSVIELEDETEKGNYLQNILIDMAGNEYLTESQELSIMIAESFDTTLREDIRSLHKGVGQAPFYVLNGAYMPAVLIETAFISNTQEEKLLKNKKFLKKISEAIFDAVVLFRKKYEAGL